MEGIQLSLDKETNDLIVELRRIVRRKLIIIVPLENHINGELIIILIPFQHLNLFKFCQI